MSEAFLGEVRMFGFGFAPLNWASCDGSTVSIRTNTALFSIIGTNYGGNGTQTFALPNLQNNVVVGAGHATSGTQYNPGDIGGETAVMINATEVPSHSHAWLGGGGRGIEGNGNAPGPTASLSSSQDCTPYVASTATPVPALMDPNTLAPYGAASPLPHTNMMPTVAMNFCICMSGTFPQRP